MKKEIDKINISSFENNVQTTPFLKNNQKTLHINKLALLYNNSMREIVDKMLPFSRKK